MVITDWPTNLSEWSSCTARSLWSAPGHSSTIRRHCCRRCDDDLSFAVELLLLLVVLLLVPGETSRRPVLSPRRVVQPRVGPPCIHRCRSRPNDFIVCEKLMSDGRCSSFDLVESDDHLGDQAPLQRQRHRPARRLRVRRTTGGGKPTVARINGSDNYWRQEGTARRKTSLSIHSRCQRDRQGKAGGVLAVL